MGTRLTLGPILFHWPPQQKRDFYFRIADEAPVDTVYLGEVVCAKRAPFFEPYYPEVIERLQSAGKTVVLSTLAEVASPVDRRCVAGVCAVDGLMIEANDATALLHLGRRPLAVGPFINVYNEDTLAFLAARGARNITLPPELAGAALAVLGASACALGVTLEVLVYGRVPLALSARCYHARAHGRVKDTCEFVCEQDPDGMVLETMQSRPILAINGVQTLSHTCLNLLQELQELAAHGISAFRLSPHSHDMVAVARVFRGVLDGAIDAAAALSELPAPGPGALFSNGFYHHREGFRWTHGPGARHGGA
jgi:collagenase-like PrtC family protease